MLSQPAPLRISPCSPPTCFLVRSDCGRICAPQKYLLLTLSRVPVPRPPCSHGTIRPFGSLYNKTYHPSGWDSTPSRSTCAQNRSNHFHVPSRWRESAEVGPSHSRDTEAPLSCCALSHDQCLEPHAAQHARSTIYGMLYVPYLGARGS